MINLSPRDAARILGGVAHGNSVSCPGPGHSRADRSLSVTFASSAPDGFIVYSHAGDDHIVCKDYVRRRLGLNGGTAPPKSKPKIVASYDYTDEGGKLLFQVVRYDPKDFRQRRPNSNGGWIWSTKGVRKVPYRLPKLLEAEHDSVIICEGEKDCDNLAKLGLLATCNAGGAGKWAPELAQYFKGRDVCVLPDNDRPGAEHAKQVFAALKPVARSVKTVHVNVRYKDISDWIADGGTADDLARIMEAAPLAEPEANSAESEALPPRPTAWWRDPKTIPMRQSLLDGHYIRRNVGETIGAGGRAKTTLGVYEAVAMAAGRDPATGKPLPEGPLRIWLLNGEEDQDEIDRRIAAVCQRYGISETDLGGRLYAQSVYETPLRIATLAPGGMALINAAVVKYMEDFIAEARIDVFMIDPLISFHAVTEASNEHMDIVIKQGFGGIAKRTNSAGEAFHHPSKPKPGQTETAVEDSRGASAIINAVRSARVLNFMTPEVAKSLGISEDDRRLHIRISNGKANMAPTGHAKWIKLFPENLDNGDQIACASPWSPPDPFKGVSTKDMELARQLAQTGAYRTDPRSPDWFGYALAKQLKLDVTHDGENDPAEIARIKAIIKTWRKNKVLDIEERADEQRKMRKFFVAGSFKDEPEAASVPSDPDDD